MTRSICIHRVPEIEPESLPDFTIAAYTAERDELLTALGTLNIAGLVLDLDDAEAINTIVAALELKRDLGVVGITGSSDAKNIIKAQHAGCTLFATRPLDPNELALALRRAVNAHGEMSTRGQTIGVLGVTGRAGATAIACHLAVELSELTKSPTALFDLDLEFLGGVARAFDVDPRFTIADLTGVGDVDAHLLDKTAMKPRPGVHVFARPRSVREAHAIHESRVSAMLRAAGNAYANTLIDLPHQLSPIAGAAIECCDKLLIVLQLTVPCVDNARRVIDAICVDGDFPEDRIEIVVNRHRKGTHTCTVEMVEKQLHHRVLAVVPSDYQSVRRSFDAGKPLSSRNPVRGAIREAAVLLTGQEQPAKRRTWLAKLGLGR